MAAALFGWRQLSEAKELREEQTRPFVVIDLDSTTRPLFDLVVRNLGPTMARDVRFKFNPPAESTDEDVDLDKIKMFRDGISTLPPGKELRTLFDNGPMRHKSDLPDLYEVTVTYEDQTGRRHYEEKIDLDFGLYWDRLTVDRRDIHDVHRELERIRKEIGNWTAKPGRGLLHVTREDIENRLDDIERQLASRRGEQEDAG